MVVAHPVRASAGDDRWRQGRTDERCFLLNTARSSAPPIFQVVLFCFVLFHVYSVEFAHTLLLLTLGLEIPNSHSRS